MLSLPDPSRIPDDQWIFEGFSNDGMRRHYLCQIDGFVFRKTENLVEDELIARNRELFNDSHGRRFRDDAMGTLIDSRPLNKFYEKGGLADHLRKGDRDGVKWVLNHENSRPYRTFRGRV